MAFPANIDSRELLEIEMATNLLMTESGRIQCLNTPDRRKASRMVIAGCESGNDFRFRHDAGTDTAHEIEALAADKPPLVDAGARPLHLDDYVALLSREAPVKRHSGGPTFIVPPGFEYKHDVTVACSDTPEGEALVAGLVADMPTALAELEFLTRADFDEPWCLAHHDGEVASMAQTVRLSPDGAESGIVAVPEWRGRGFAAAAVSEWALRPDLSDHVLFYSTDSKNVSSQRVAQRLGLRLFGAGYAIT